MTFFTTPELLEIGDIPMTALGDKPTRTEALKYYRRAGAHYNLDIRQHENVDEVGGSDGKFVLETTDRLNNKRCYRAKKVILATGYYDLPVKMNIPGEDLDKVFHYYKEAHPFYGSDVAVIGSKNSAAIVALECYRAGAPGDADLSLDPA